MKNRLFNLVAPFLIFILSLIWFQSCRQTEDNHLDINLSRPKIIAPTLEESKAVFERLKNSATNSSLTSTDPCNVGFLWNKIIPLWDFELVQPVYGGALEVRYVPIAPIEELAFGVKGQAKLVFYKDSLNVTRSNIIIYHTPNPQLGIDSTAAKYYTGPVYQINMAGEIKNTYLFEQGQYVGIFNFPCNASGGSNNLVSANDRSCPLNCHPCECIYSPTCIVSPIPGMAWIPGPCYTSLMVPCDSWRCECSPATPPIPWEGVVLPVPTPSNVTPLPGGGGWGGAAPVIYGNLLFGYDGALDLIEQIFPTEALEEGLYPGVTVADFYRDQLNCLLTYQGFANAVGKFLQDHNFSAQAKTVAQGLLNNLCTKIPQMSQSSINELIRTLKGEPSSIPLDESVTEITGSVLMPPSISATTPICPGMFDFRNGDSGSQTSGLVDLNITLNINGTNRTFNYPRLFFYSPNLSGNCPVSLSQLAANAVNMAVISATARINRNDLVQVVNNNNPNTNISIDIRIRHTIQYEIHRNFVALLNSSGCIPQGNQNAPYVKLLRYDDLVDFQQIYGTSFRNFTATFGSICP